ncbi:hypothetical protein BS47DRAFT_1044339 [Hydnum rufescens UP504]|uniref:Uncharacterized protein n=1 Tax=Hydnum rufescens UP504 TaxID=1448309 RepID=A0A9P6AXQ4_9AGAM|nr:hypothetical protein BS47DRAFT_1044339 [Hydnum rufescens UP504]
MAAIRVGEQACQRDSYLKVLDTVVVSCVPVTASVRTGTLPPTTKSSRKGPSKQLKRGLSKRRACMGESIPSYCQAVVGDRVWRYRSLS